MIGQFWFAESPCRLHVAVRLDWRSGERVGRVEPPAEVAERLPFDVPVEDEFITLPMALGFAVTIAALAGSKLTITGDVTAWPEDWGVLSPRPKKVLPTH